MPTDTRQILTGDSAPDALALKIAASMNGGNKIKEAVQKSQRSRDSAERKAAAAEKKAKDDAAAAAPRLLEEAMAKLAAAETRVAELTAQASAKESVTFTRFMVWTYVDRQGVTVRDWAEFTGTRADIEGAVREYSTALIGNLGGRPKFEIRIALD